LLLLLLLLLLRDDLFSPSVQALEAAGARKN
jgi:hypothetical protein